MTSRKKESIKLILLSALTIFMLSMVLATIIMAIKTPKCNCYEINAKEYNNEYN